MASIIVHKFNIYQFVYHLSHFLSSGMHMALLFSGDIIAMTTLSDWTVKCSSWSDLNLGMV